MNLVNRIYLLLHLITAALATGGFLVFLASHIAKPESIDYLGMIPTAGTAIILWIGFVLLLLGRENSFWLKLNRIILIGVSILAIIAALAFEVIFGGSLSSIFLEVLYGFKTNPALSALFMFPVFAIATAILGFFKRNGSEVRA